METNVCPKTWLAESILATIFCCLPFGAVGIVYAAKVSGLFAQQQYEEAQKASSKAKTWTTISFCVGLGCAVFYGIATVFTMLTGGMQ